MVHLHDERDAKDIDVDAINATVHYSLHAVFATTSPLPGDTEALVRHAVESVEGVEVRGWYDVAGFRADADLMVWLLAPTAEALQAAWHRFRNTDLGLHLEPVWSVMGVHRPSEFNKAHVPSCLSGVAPRPWLCVYPFVRSYDWYSIDEDKRRVMLRDHGMAARDYPDVRASTLQTFALSDYEWILSFEADELHRIVDCMRVQRAVEARLHVREETPFFTGPRVELAEWVDRQPTV